MKGQSMSLIKQCLVGMGAIFSLPVVASTSGVYKVPAGLYMPQDVYLTASNVEFRLESDGYYRLRYKFPRELDGSDPRRVRMKSKSASEPYKLENEADEPVKATAECQVVDQDVSCDITYVKNSDDVFPINVDAANEYIQTQQLDVYRVTELEGAQQSIMHEAAGVLTIRGGRR